MDNWGSHKLVLLKLLDLFPDSNFLELGTGNNSTPFIINKTKYSIHLETNLDWFEKMKIYEKENHKIEYFNNYTKYEWNCDYFNNYWDLCLIDNAPGESRQSNLLKLKDKSKILICHDTEEIINEEFNYGWDFSHFKKVYTYTKHPVTTTICSNIINDDIFELIIKNF